jgi:hypothetical protein
MSRDKKNFVLHLKVWRQRCRPASVGGKTGIRDCIDHLGYEHQRTRCYGILERTKELGVVTYTHEKMLLSNSINVCCTCTLTSCEWRRYTHRNLHIFVSFVDLLIFSFSFQNHENLKVIWTLCQSMFSVRCFCDVAYVFIKGEAVKSYVVFNKVIKWKIDVDASGNMDTYSLKFILYST